LLGRIQHCIQAPENDHWQDKIAISAANIEIAQDIIGDAPDEVGNPIEVGWFH
jgi:hypothetical protein